MNYSTNSLLSLISHIHSQNQDFLQKEFKSLGLDELATSHANILFCLRNGGMPLGSLSKIINRDKSTTTVLVRKLCNEGLVKIQKDENDLRKKIVLLTSQGKNYNERTENLAKKMQESCFENFSDHDKSILLELLLKISQNLDAHAKK